MARFRRILGIFLTFGGATLRASAVVDDAHAEVGDDTRGVRIPNGRLESMGFFRRSRDQGDDVTKPTPFVAEVLRRIGEEYGGFDAIAPLPQGAGGAGVEVSIHIGGSPAHERSEFLRGTGIVRSVRVFAEHTEVYEGGTMIAHFDDLTTAVVFGEREPL